MWNSEDRARKPGKDRGREPGGGLEEEVRLKIKVSNEGSLPESMEDITDDEVFKELINIVVDVFSHKSEKCLLTFELPSQTDCLATASYDSLIASGSDYRLDEPLSDISIPYKSCESIPSRKSSKHERHIKLPINKPKHNTKKLFDKRLNPIVQTVLHAKQGFTDLEKLFKLKHRSAYRGRRHKCPGNEGECLIEALGDQNVIGTEWVRQNEEPIPNTWNDGVEEGSEKLILYPQVPARAEDYGDSSGTSSLYNQLHEFIITLGTMMKVCHKKSYSDSHKIEYHITEIKAHMAAIGGYLFGGSSSPSFSGEVNDVLVYPNTEKVDTLISRTRKRRKDVTLYRIATNKSFRSRSHSRRRRRKRNNYRYMKANKSKQDHPKKKDEAEISLEGVLRCYQRVKREETELVKILLNRLGLANVKTPPKKHREHHGSIKDRGHQSTGNSFDRENETILDSRNPNNRRLLNSDKKMSQKCKASVQKDISIENLSAILEEPVKALKRSILARQSLEMRGRRNRKRHTKCTIPTSSRVSAENDGAHQSDANDSVQSCFPTQEDMIKCSSEVYVQSLDDMPVVEEKVVSRMQNAAERLEHMQDLVEKKMGYLCKQKERYQEMKSSLLNSADEKNESNVDRKFNNKESGRSKEQSKESQIEVYEMPEATMKTYPTHVRYTNVNLDESKDFRELLKGFEEAASEVRHCNFKDKQIKSSEVLKKEINSKEDQSLGGRTYICNYMVEMIGCDMADDQYEDTRQLEIVSREENNVVVVNNDGKNQTPYRKESVLKQLEVEEVIKGVKEEDDESRETLMNMYTSSTGFVKQKAGSSVKKRVSGSNFPRKAWCTLS